MVETPKMAQQRSKETTEQIVETAALIFAKDGF